MTIMNFRNSSTYVQRQINIIFWNFRDFSRAYVNDIVMFNKTFEKHIEHLFKIFELFELFDKLNITLKFNKIYFEYFIVVLLDQKIDNFEFIIIEKKLKIIFKFQFSVILKLLKSYLNFIDWMRDYVFYYVQLSNFLQIRKILMLKDSSIKNNVRKRFNNNNRLNIFIDSKMKFYEII